MTTTTASRNTHITQRNALALIITNAYRARHNMPPVDHHASVDEDIAEAIINEGWTPPLEVNTISTVNKIDLLNESITNGVGSITSHRAKSIRDTALQVANEHTDWTDRGNQHSMHCMVDSSPWPCPEYKLASAAYIKAGGNPDDM